MCACVVTVTCMMSRFEAITSYLNIRLESFSGVEIFSIINSLQKSFS